MSFDLMMVTDKGLNKFVDQEECWKQAAQLVVYPEGGFNEWLKGNVNLEVLIRLKN